MSLNIFNREHCMVDLETLSTNKNAAIVSIGAVRFTFEKGISEDFYVNVDPKSCVDKGLHVSKSTLEWWGKQSREVRDALKADRKSLETALGALNMFVTDADNVKTQLMWAQGVDFDYGVLHSAFVATGMVQSWKYYNQMDSRTIFTMMGVNNYQKRRDKSDHHNALGDAIAQTKSLIKCFA